MELTLTAMAPTGEAIGRADGLVVFVPYGLPGETVEAEIVHRRRNFARARLVRVIVPAQERVTAPCPHFGRCGGCQWQHADYETQLLFKTNIVREQLARIGKLGDVLVRQCLPCPRPYGYRNHIQLAASPDGRPGYRAAQSHRVVEIEQCPIADARINAWLGQAPNISGEIDLRAGVNTGEALFGAGESFHERIDGRVYTVSAQSFFQVNTLMAEVLVHQVVAAAQVQTGDRVLDLYAGVGLFTWPLAERAERVIGVEGSPAAVADARRNLAHLPNVRFIQADVAEALRKSEIRQSAWQVVVLDPPRAGVDRPALAQLAALRAPKLAYVSCDPATLARDAGFLVGQGYDLEFAQPLDMFPQTYHVETLAFFRLNLSS